VLADVPTAREQGVDLDCSVWIGLAFPKDTPKAIVERLAEVANEAVETPILRERYENLGISIVAPERRTPAYFARFIPAEIKKWAAPIKASGVTAD
jgi:tripartite-type tricarboxylate transporter receptor subunit TctC